MNPPTHQTICKFNQWRKQVRGAQSVGAQEEASRFRRNPAPPLKLKIRFVRALSNHSGLSEF